MGIVLELILAFLLPTAAAYAIVMARRWRRWVQARRPAAPGQPLERLGADLRRLHDELERAESGLGRPGKHLRCTAVRAAYVDTLTVACRRLDVAPPASIGASVPLTEIYRAEAGLRQRGLDVRAVPTH